MAHPTQHDPHTPGFLPFRALAEKPSRWIGLAALMAWADLLLCFEGVLRDQVLEQGGLVHDPFFLGLTAAAAATLGLFTLLRKALQGRQMAERLLRPNALMGFAALGALVSAAAVGLTSVAQAVDAWAPALLGVVAGIAAALLTLGWARLLGTLDLRAALLMVSLAAALQWLALVAIALTGPVAHLALVLAMPVGAGWALRHNLHGEEVAVRPPSPAAASRAGGPLARLSLAMLVFSLVAQFVWCFFIKMLPGRLEVGLFPAVFATVAATTVGVAALCALVMEHQRGYRLELYYRAAFLFCLGGVTATGMAVADLSQAELLASYTAVYAGYSLLGPTMWMLVLGYAFTRKESAASVASAVFGCQYLGLFAGFWLVERLESSTMPSGDASALGAIAVFAGSILLATAYVGLFPERSLLSLSPRLFGMSPASVEDRCRQLAQARGLTPRELEVLTLLARGRDAGFIGDELGISRNTVNVHRKAVFAKLGVHSQQELLSAVEGVDAE